MKTLLQILLILTLAVGCQTRDRNDPVFAWLSAILLQESGTASSSGTVPIENSTTEGTTNTVPFTMSVNDVTGDTDFLFNSLEQMSVQISIQDAFNNEVTPVVRIIQYTDPLKMTLFQAVPDANGNVTGSFTYDVNNPYAVLEVVYNGQTYTFEIDLTGLTEINRLIRINGVVSTVVFLDSDGDGVMDVEDAYPNDPTRSSTVRTPNNSFTTVAYEDLYPKQGDADFNDYVVRVWNEEDLDATGKVKRIRGTYEHIAKGAGYNHLLYLRTPDGVNGNYTLNRYTADGVLETSFQQSINGDIEILPNSSTTLSKSNTAQNQTQVKGKKATIEIIFDTPIDRKTLGMAPFDLFIKVLNTGHDIHFLGKYKNADGSDKYLDPNGFPWAIAVPGVWKHPYERADVRSGYENFRLWYESRGSQHTDWFNFPILNYVFPVVE